jgi:hypothetical protein
MNTAKPCFFMALRQWKDRHLKRMTACFGSDIFIPHAVIVDDSSSRCSTEPACPNRPSTPYARGHTRFFGCALIRAATDGGGGSELDLVICACGFRVGALLRGADYMIANNVCCLSTISGAACFAARPAQPLDCALESEVIT